MLGRFRRERSLAIVVLALGSFAGCAGRGVVMPRTTAMYQQARSVDAGAACFGQLDRTPLPSFPTDGGQDISVGIINWHFPGADPAPCWRRHENRAIGLVKWDFRIAGNLIKEGRRLERAELVQRWENQSRSYGDYWEGGLLADVKIASAAWEARHKRADPADPSVNVSSTPTPIIATVPFNPSPRTRTVDVTGLVRSWLDGTVANHGLVWDSVSFGIGDTVTRTVVERVHVQLRLYFSEP